jgi:hypothetical protein
MEICQKKWPSLKDANDIPPPGSNPGLTGAAMPDSDLLALACKGDQSAFEYLFERYQLPLLRWIWRFVKNYEQAEDILQQVFLQGSPSFRILLANP